MQASVQRLIEQSSRASQAGTVSFAAVVDTLMQAGVESYFADYRACSTTYYLPDGDSCAIELKVPPTAIAADFDAAALQAAIRGAQRGDVRYPEFQNLSRAAGCVGYFVWIAGRHVVYFGRRGEQHVEKFPS
jgi:uncharacterized protein YbcV (DUF1398 family)